MAYSLKKLQYKDVSFDKEVEALLKYLRDTGWKISAKPTGYDEYRKTYQDFQGQEDLDEEALLKSFDGHDGAGTCSLPFPMRVSLPHVAYDDCCQGRKPLETLVGSILGYGMFLGMRVAEINTSSDIHYRMTWMGHAYNDLRYEDNTELALLILKEIDEYRTNFDEGHHEIFEKFKRLKLELLCKKLKGVLAPLFNETSERIKFTQDSEVHKILEKIYSEASLSIKTLKKHIHGIGYNIQKVNGGYLLYPRKKKEAV